MSRHSKAKGSRYEREFVERVCALNLDAQRVPLSGAMAGYPDDVVVNGSIRVECKYRKSGTGFTRLHTWHEGDGHAVRLIGANLTVFTLTDWCERIHCRAADAELPELTTTNKEARCSMLLAWMGDADALAVRRARSPWLVLERTTHD